MKTDKSFIVIMTIIVAIIIGLAYYYFTSTTNSTLLKKENSGLGNTSEVGNSTSDKNTTSGGNSASNNTTGSSSDAPSRVTLSLVKEYDEFFTINTLINEYYQDMIDDDKTTVLDKLDAAYIKTHNITKNNIKNFMEQNYENITYVAKNMYVKGLNGILYYFTTGEIQNYDFAAEVLTEQERINYLVIVDQKNKSYSITPLVSDISMFDYAQEYKMGSKTIENNDNNKYKINSISDKNVAIYYLNYFKNMLYLNSEKAYNMLDSQTKSKYADFEDFVNNLPTIYDSLSTNLLSYAANGENGSRKYSVISTNQKRVYFLEKSIMDFTVTIVN